MTNRNRYNNKTGTLVLFFVLMVSTVSSSPIAPPSAGIEALHQPNKG
jgi:hypothetical protein